MESFVERVEALMALGPGGLARFEEGLEAGWIEEALVATGSASVRRRKFPAEQAVWLVLGMGLFEDRSIRDVVDHLELVVPGVTSLAPSAVTQARARLGAAPMQHLFERVADRWSLELGTGYRGLSLFGVDGVCMRVQDTTENLEHFGKPGGRAGQNDAGYPQVRMTCLLNLSTRMLRAARFGPYRLSEEELARPLWDALPPKSLTIFDRGFSSYVLFASLMNRGGDRHFMVRMREDANPEEVEQLADGSTLVRIRPSRTVLKEEPQIRSEIVGRVIAYQHPGGRPGRIFTSLLDPQAYPAQELIRVYHERWEIEIAYDELKTHMNERKESLRSKTPEGVAQEVWGLLTVYNLVRREMMMVARANEVEPNRVSFTSSLMWIRSFWLTAMRTAPGNIPKQLASLRSSLNVLILPPRRTERRYPRHVKIKMSKFPRNRGKPGPEDAK